MTLLLIGHIIGIAIGAGGATMSDILFLTSISDDFIDASELKLLKRASQIVILGLLLLYATGIGFLFVRTEGVGERFWAKLTIVIILTLNGFIMHRKIFPTLESLVKNQTPISSPAFQNHIFLFIFAGTVSAVSWYSALILGAWQTLALSYGAMLGLYLAAIVLAFIVGRTLFYYFLGSRLSRLTAKPTLAKLLIQQFHL